MGETYSVPLPRVDTGGFLCMTIREMDRLRVMHAPQEIIAMVQRVAL